MDGDFLVAAVGWIGICSSRGYWRDDCSGNGGRKGSCSPGQRWRRKPVNYFGSCPGCRRFQPANSVAKGCCRSRRLGRRGNDGLYWRAIQRYRHRPDHARQSTAATSFCEPGGCKFFNPLNLLFIMDPAQRRGNNGSQVLGEAGWRGRGCGRLFASGGGP